MAFLGGAAGEQYKLRNLIIHADLHYRSTQPLTLIEEDFQFLFLVLERGRLLATYLKKKTALAAGPVTKILANPIRSCKKHRFFDFLAFLSGVGFLERLKNAFA